ncbi:permease [Spirochaetia bacterium]|nr:permease [Spirochaetia bacterium]
MGIYKNFATVIFCTAPWADKVTEGELRDQIAFFRKYADFDKVYLETYRSVTASKEQIEMCKRVFAEHNIQVSGAITTTADNLNEADKKRQRLFNTFCYSNDAMRNHLKKAVEYTAGLFDDFIIDDFFFSQCRCEDCQKEKGKRSWEEFKLAKMLDVSENLVIGPARSINPKIKITIKFPNWRESFQETGYNPAVQKDMFDFIYTGTETRHPAQTDQHLPRYLSYSLMRYMENAAPGRNGGGWFDPYECYPIDSYLEQAYLTAFSRPKEVMLFCWPSLYNNKVVTPLGFRLKQLDEILTQVGKPVGVPVYIPYNAQGEDHLEDYLGMLGIPFEPTPEFPAGGGTVFLTVQALQDGDIITKLKAHLNAGGRAVVTSGFVRAAFEKNNGGGGGIEELTSARWRGRYIAAKEYHITKTGPGMQPQVHRNAAETVLFPLLEHRNNASWSLLNAGEGGQHGSILLRDTFGKGEMIILAVPDLYSDLAKIPQAALSRIRKEFQFDGPAGAVSIELPEGTGARVSLFLYDNKTFGLYAYTADGASPELVRVIIRGGKTITEIPLTGNVRQGGATSVKGDEISPFYSNAHEAAFDIHLSPGDFAFFRYS